MDKLPDLVPGRWALVILPRHAGRLVLELAARLGARGALLVLDCGNCFNAYTVARGMARHTPDVNQALSRIQVARAFTCYQVLTLLEGASAGEAPVLVLDLLSTFLDESVNLAERQRLLGLSIAELQRLGRSAPLAVSARAAKPGQSEAELLLNTLQESADRVWWIEPEQPAAPLRLF